MTQHILAGIFSVALTLPGVAWGATGPYCGKIEFDQADGAPYLSILESLFFTGQINRFRIVTSSAEALQSLRDLDGSDACLSGELNSVGGEARLDLTGTVVPD